MISFSVVLFAHTAYAGFITQSDFDSTTIVTDLNDLAIPTGNVAAPLSLSWDVARGSALLSVIDTETIPEWDQENEAEQSASRPCRRGRLTDGKSRDERAIPCRVLPS